MRPLREAQAFDADPLTPARITELAAELIRRDPSRTVPVVVYVQVGRFRKRPGRAIAYQAWPVGEFTVSNRDDSWRTYQYAVDARGRMVFVDGSHADTDMRSYMTWDDPADDPRSRPIARSRSHAATGNRVVKGHVLRKLIQDFDELS